MGRKMDALTAFIETIERLGGVQRCEEGRSTIHRPLGDPSWADLGEAYMMACQALKRTPKVKL